MQRSLAILLISFAIGCLAPAQAPAATPCSTVEECDDGVECTVDSCGDAGFCVHAVENCLSESKCDDINLAGLGYRDAVERRIREGTGSGQAASIIVDAGRYAEVAGEARYAVLRLQGSDFHTVTEADYLSVSAIQNLVLNSPEQRLLVIATLPPAGPLAAGTGIVATQASETFSLLPKICVVAGGAIPPFQASRAANATTTPTDN